MKTSTGLTVLLGLAIPCCSVGADAHGARAVASSPVCRGTPLEQSQEMIRAILNDLTESYSPVGGGGISGIKQTATRTYVISIAQEERIDQITYELEVGEECAVRIVRKTASTVDGRQG